MSGYVTRLRRGCVNRYRKWYYHFNLFRYNASKDWRKWSALSASDKMESYRSMCWKEQLVYLRDLTYPRVERSVSQGLSNRVDNSNIAKIPFMITKQMKLSLLDLGYSIRDINSLAPLAAHAILTKNRTKPTEHSTSPATDRTVELHPLGESENLVQSTADEVPLSNTVPLDSPIVVALATSRPSLDSATKADKLQRGLGNVKLKVCSSIAAIDKANSVISAAINDLERTQK